MRGGCAGGEAGHHLIQGMGAGFIPDVLDVKLLDRVVQVHSDEALALARRLHAEESLLAGISSGATFAAALKVILHSLFFTLYPKLNLSPDLRKSREN